jgi:hypothetical protein
MGTGKPAVAICPGTERPEAAAHPIRDRQEGGTTGVLGCIGLSGSLWDSLSAFSAVTRHFGSASYPSALRTFV